MTKIMSNYDLNTEIAGFFKTDPDEFKSNLDLKQLKNHDRRGKWTRDELIEKGTLTMSTIEDHKKKEIIDMKDKPPIYVKYKDWKDRDYYSTQHEEQNTVKKEKKFISIGDINNVENQRAHADELVNMELEPLDIEKDIMDDFTVVLVGRRRSGKTFFSRWLMYHLRHRFSAGIVITGTKLNNFWAHHVPEEYIHDVENINEALNSFYERQTYILANPQLGIDPRAFMILDDILSDKYKIRFSKSLQRAFTDGRHYKVFTLVTTQDPHGIPPDLRENTDMSVVFRQHTEGRKESVCNNYVSYIEDKHTRKGVLWNQTGMWDLEKNTKFIQDETTKDEDTYNAVPQALCVLMASLSENIYDIFKRGIAEEVPDFILGNLEYWNAMSKGRWVDLFETFKDVTGGD